MFNLIPWLPSFSIRPNSQETVSSLKFTNSTLRIGLVKQKTFYLAPNEGSGTMQANSEKGQSNKKPGKKKNKKNFECFKHSELVQLWKDKNEVKNIRNISLPNRKKVHVLLWRFRSKSKIKEKCSKKYKKIFLFTFFKVRKRRDLLD